MIRIDALWLAAQPIDMRCGADTLLARVVQVFGCAQAHHGISRAGLRFPFLNCPRCLVPLHMGSGTDEPLAEPADADQLAAAEQVGTMIAKLQQRGDPGTLVKPDLRRVITSALGRELCVGTNDFVRKALISKGTLSSLLNVQKAGLDTWVRVSLAADVSLAGLFAPELWKEGVFGRSISWRSVISEARQRPPLDWHAVRDEAMRILQGASVISCYELGRRLKADPQYLKKRLGARVTGRRNLLGSLCHQEGGPPDFRTIGRPANEQGASID